MRGLKDKKIIKPYMKKKLVLGFFLFALVFFALSASLYTMIKTNNDEYSKIVLSQRQSSYDTRVITAKRGDIIDRNGQLLATSIKVYNLILDPKIITTNDNTVYYNQTIDCLSSFFKVDFNDIKNIIDTRKNSAYYRYKKSLSYEEKTALEEYIAEKNEELKSNNSQERIRGIWFEDDYKRYYPYSTLASNVIGFSNSAGTSGTLGLEQYYNETLVGVNGRRFGYLDNEYSLSSVSKDAIDGSTLVSTIDIGLQYIVQKHLDDWQKNDIGSKSASCIVMDPNNGEVLAMGSTNSFDLNNPRDLSYKYSEDDIYKVGAELAIAEIKKDNEYFANEPDIAKMQVELGEEFDEELANEQVRLYNEALVKEIESRYTREELIKKATTHLWYQNWRNLCISDTYEPGSTSKVFTVSGGIEEGVVDESSHFLCEGWLELDDGERKWRIRCNNRKGHGDLTLAESLMYSCNMSMSQIAFDEGSNNFIKYQDLFGFGQKTNIDLPAEAGAEKLVYNEKTMGRTSLATNAFGQNFNCTMIQLASAFASVINGGKFYEPHLVKQIRNANGSIKDEKIFTPTRQTISKQTSDFLRAVLYQTVETGTGAAAKIDGYTVGGKTGTAEKLPRKDKNYLVSFCGFAPIENPKLLVYVIVDTPNLQGEEQAKAVFATKIFNKIMFESLGYLNIEPVDKELSKTYTYDIAEGYTKATLSEAKEIIITVEEANTDNMFTKVKKLKMKDEEIPKEQVGEEYPDLMPSVLEEE